MQMVIKLSSYIYAKVKVTYHILPLNPLRICGCVQCKVGIQVPSVFRVLNQVPQTNSWSAALPLRRIKFATCVWKPTVLFLGSIWFHWPALCFSHKISVYKANYIVLLKCALFLGKRFKLILQGKKKDHQFNFMPFPFSPLRVGCKDLLLPPAELRDGSVDLCWRRNNIPRFQTYIRGRKSAYGRPPMTTGQLREGLASLWCLWSGTGLELFNLLTVWAQPLVLGYTADKNLYKYLDTEIINYCFFPHLLWV